MSLSSKKFRMGADHSPALFVMTNARPTAHSLAAPASR